MYYTNETMAIPEYYSTVYKIDNRSQIAKSINLTGYNRGILPEELSTHDLAKIISKMQKVCFNDENTNNENTKRIIELFSKSSQPTFIVAISLGYLHASQNYMDFVDGGVATVQKAKYEMISYQQPWINEIGRAKYTKISVKSPIPTVMDLIEKYITKYLMNASTTKTNGMYLYIEKTPEHGDPAFLLGYYYKYGFVKMEYEDDDYFYMCKKLCISPPESLH